MQQLRQSIDWNNDGVTFMAQGDTSSALRCLSAALRAIQEQMACVEPGDETGAAAQPKLAPYFHRPRLHSLRLGTRPVLSVDGDAGGTVHSTISSRFLYGHGLIISCFNTGETDESRKTSYAGSLEDDGDAQHDDTFVTCCACVLFNLALLHNSRVFKVDEPRELRTRRMDMIKAQELYRLTLSLIQEDADSDPVTLETSCRIHFSTAPEPELSSSSSSSSSSSPSSSSLMRQTWLLLIQMAALNNLGALQDLDVRRFPKEQVSQTFSALLSVMRGARMDHPITSLFFLATIDNTEWKGMADNCVRALLEVIPPTTGRGEAAGGGHNSCLDRGGAAGAA